MAMQEVYEAISKIAPTSAPVFIHGESGTGKDICARMIHEYSDQRDAPFIAINCAALPAELVESALFGHTKGAFTGAHKSRDGAITKAQNGTLFLDEIGDMPLDLQAKLLRFCQDYTYYKLGSDTLHTANIRLICASNKDMKHQIAQKYFREDLYYRLNIADISLPPLRDRQEDILEIARYYLNFYSMECHKNFQDLSNETCNILCRYDWPGNVRELQNTIQKIVIMEIGRLVTSNMLPQTITQKTQTNTAQTKPNHYNKSPLIPASMPLWKIEKNAIQAALDIARGDVSKAATMLDVAPSTIYRKLKIWKNVK
jgi:two-component system repressor protein LuxO